MNVIGTVFLVCFLGLTVLIAPSVLVLFIECLAALFHRRTKIGAIDEPKAAVLIPAHNEEESIGETLDAILAQATPNDRVIVIADNCTDRTAHVARQAGAEVIVRSSVDERGKGYALAYGVEHLRSNPPDVVVVIDADTHVTSGTIRAISREVASTGRPTQAINVLSPPRESGCRDQISAFAFRVRNLVRPLGQSMLAAPCQLMGTGMALPWAPLSGMKLASSNLVEDLQLGIDFAMAGLPPRFSVEGKVTGVLPGCSKAATNQRKRWEHGHLATMFTQVPRLLLSAVRQRRFDLVWLAMDIAVPPLALVVVLWTAMTVMAMIVGLTLQLWLPAIVSIVLGLMLGGSVMISWARFATDIPLTAIATVPFYVLQKLPIYLGFLVRRQVRWVRTERI